MALDVYLCCAGDPLRTAHLVRRVGSFEAEEGAYWFFYPYFERLAGETGLMIDLYDTVEFAGTALDALEHTLQEVSASLADRPDHWEEVTGWRMAPERQELRAVVRKAELLRWVGYLDSAVRLARLEGLILRFHGD